MTTSWQPGEVLPPRLPQGCKPTTSPGSLTAVLQTFQQSMDTQLTNVCKKKLIASTQGWTCLKLGKKHSKRRSGFLHPQILLSALQFQAIERELHLQHYKYVSLCSLFNMTVYNIHFFSLYRAKYVWSTTHLMLTNNSTQVNRKFILLYNTPLYVLNPHSLPVGWTVHITLKLWC